MSTAKLNATGLRWVAELSNYQFDILYRPGRKNGDADGLSRQFDNLEKLEEECTEQMKLEDLATVMAVRLNSAPPKCSEKIDVAILQFPGPMDFDPISPEDFASHQSSDPVIAPVYRCDELYITERTIVFGMMHATEKNCTLECLACTGHQQWIKCTL